MAGLSCADLYIAYFQWGILAQGFIYYQHFLSLVPRLSPLVYTCIGCVFFVTGESIDQNYRNRGESLETRLVLSMDTYMYIYLQHCIFHPSPLPH